ncbi:hypothetical protein [uncultured Cedecea sp.]|uniref:hypothetical protein n=1 Tax=uncultured Cedecea sp. TaxID=988762 RepID=UPI002619A817|nr:hypothetical protein [uncultured Cedecea sp.]
MYRLPLFIALSLYAIQAASAIATPPEQAQEPRKKPDWTLQVTPFLWAASLNGKVSPFQRGSTLDVDKSFSDVMEHLRVGGFLNIWARQQRFVLSGNLMYVDTRDARASGPLSAFQIPGLGITIPAGANVEGKVDSTQFMATLLGGYRVLDTPEYTLDMLGGMRFWHISNSVSVTTSHPAIGSHSASYSEDFKWVDPLVGMRAFFPLGDNWSVQSEADIGGFGAGSDLTWSVLASATYSFTDTLSASAGYKALKVNYDHNGHVYNTLLSGPVVGMTWRF